MAEGQSTTVSPVEYRPIPEYPGYRVGDDGSVWSCWVRRSLGRYGGIVRVIDADRWRRLCPVIDRRGRLTVKLCRDGNVSRFFIHRLVLQTFVGPCPQGMECCHYPDREPSNCRLVNLRWDTKQGNMKDKEYHGNAPKGVKNPRAKLTPEKVAEIKRRVRAGEDCRSIAAEFGISKGNVWFICSGKTWPDIQ